MFEYNYLRSEHTKRDEKKIETIFVLFSCFRTLYSSPYHSIITNSTIILLIIISDEKEKEKDATILSLSVYLYII